MVILDVLDYPWGVLQHLSVLQTSDTLCDVRLTCDTGGISAHKLILMAASPFLKTRISLDQTREQDLIYFDNTPIEMLQKVVSYLYSGKLEVDDDDLEAAMKVCKDLELDSAVAACKQYLKKEEIEDLELEVDCIKVKEEEEVVLESDDGKKKKEKIKNRRVQRMPRKRIKVEVIDDGDELEIAAPPAKRGRGRPATKVKTAQTGLKPKPRGRPKKSEGGLKLKLKPVKVPSVKSRAQKKVVKSRMVKKDREDILTEGQDDENTEISKEDETSGGANDTVGEKVTNELKDDVAAEDQDGGGGDDGGGDGIGDDDDGGGDWDHESDHYDDSTDEEEVKMKVKSEGVKGKKRGRKPLGTSGKRSYIQVRRRKRFPCTSCPRVLSSHKRLVFHEYSKHGVAFDRKRYPMVPCKEEGCNYVAANRHNLDTHMKSRHGVDRPHICEFCGKAFKLPNVLATHINIHTGKKIWKCDTCGENFNQQSGLDVHIKRHHIGESSWGELCHLCSEKFLQKSELAWHLFKYHDMPLPEKYKAYVCDICNYLTKSSQDLERHQNAHKGIKQHMCPVCSKSCSTKSELKRHVSFHGEKRFKCTFESCSYACTDSIGLGKHIKLMHTHRHLKPYVCPVCPYKTGVKGNLDKHIRQVHNLVVVTKHTVALKMKYAMFESGDIITQEGRLVATAKERKELEKNPECVQQCEEVNAAVRESIRAANSIDPTKSSSSSSEVAGATPTPLPEKPDNVYHQTVPLDLNASHTGAGSAASPVPGNHVHPISPVAVNQGPVAGNHGPVAGNQGPMAGNHGPVASNHVHPMVPQTEGMQQMPPISSIGSYGCMQDGVVVPSSNMAVPQDLRMSLGPQTMGSNMYHDMGPGNGPLYISQ